MLNYLLLIAILLTLGCAFSRHTDITVSNVYYNGVRADIHYLANTEGSILNGDCRPQTNTTK